MPADLDGHSIFIAYKKCFEFLEGKGHTIKVNIMDNQGKQVYSFDFQPGTEPMVNISALSAGVYYVHVGESALHQGSFVKK